MNDDEETSAPAKPDDPIEPRQTTLAKGHTKSREEFWDEAFGCRFICTPDEIARMFPPTNATDYLMRLRLDAVMDHPRLYRVILARRNTDPAWTFTRHFDDSAFSDFLSHTRPEDLKRCSKVPAGLIVANDPNGACITTKFGDVIVVSEALRHFLYFMNIAFLGFTVEVPHEVRIQALRIAVRTMLLSEALDFDLDPRGVVPPAVEAQVQSHVRAQMEFVCGHEYGHHCLGHVGQAHLSKRSVLSIPGANVTEGLQTYYNHHQEKEFAADLWSITRADRRTRRASRLWWGALTFFAFLRVYEQAREQISPSMILVKTHPDPLDRFHRVCSVSKRSTGLPVSRLLDLVDQYRAFLSEDIALNFDAYETYGSFYLASWRGPVLIDRKDF